MTVVALLVSVPLCLPSSHPPNFLFICRQSYFTLPAPLCFVLLLFHVCFPQLAALHSLRNKAIPRMKKSQGCVVVNTVLTLYKVCLLVLFFPSVFEGGVSINIFRSIDKCRYDITKDENHKGTVESLMKTKAL